MRFPLPRFARFWLPVIGYAALIFVGAGLQTAEPQKNEAQPYRQRYDLGRIQHHLVYAGLGLLLFRAFVVGESLGLGRSLLLAACFGMAYGVSDEIHQHFLPGRSCKLSDAVADAGGVWLGSLLGLAIVRVRSRALARAS